MWIGLSGVMCALAAYGAVSKWVLAAMFAISMYRSEEAFIREE